MATVKEFVTDTLTQISEAVREFSAQSDETGASATPHLDGGQDPAVWAQNGLLLTSTIRDGLGRHQGRRFATVVDFDVAVTTTEAEGTAAGGGIQIVQVFKAGVDTTAESTNTSVSCVKFRIPLELQNG
ncbi:MAG: hypothetical protein ACMVO3_16230 [Thalassobaculum sp.]